MAGILSKGIKLYYDSSATSTPSWTEIENLQECPSLGGSVDKVETTTFANGAHTYINGLKEYGDMAFKFLYDNSASTSNYRVCKSLEGLTKSFKVEFPDALTGEGAHHGTEFVFDGQAHTSVDGQSVNGAITFTLTIAVGSDITITDAQ